jgi:acetyl esterase/lipase
MPTHNREVRKVLRSVKEVLVLLHPRIIVDRRTVEDVARSTGRDLGVDVAVVEVDDHPPGSSAGEVDHPAVLVLPDDLDVSTHAQARGWSQADRRVLVRFDPHARERDTSPQLSAHLRGIGLGGISWAIRAAVHAARHPAEVIRYGDHADQFGQLRRPVGDDQPTGLGVLIHGGYWRSRWQLDLMDAIAIDLAERGFLSVNLEYRRPDRHGWQATLDDLHAGVRQASTAAARSDRPTPPIALIGHSAGAQLALQIAEERAASEQPVAAVVALAGVVDLHAAEERDLSEGAVRLALGGRPDELPERYQAASPLARPHRQVPTIVTFGTEDDPDLVEMNRRFVAAATGSPIDVIDLPGDHVDVIDPATRLWEATMGTLIERITGAGEPFSLSVPDRPVP